MIIDIDNCYKKGSKYIELLIGYSDSYDKNLNVKRTYKYRATDFKNTKENIKSIEFISSKFYSSKIYYSRFPIHINPEYKINDTVTYIIPNYEKDFNFYDDKTIDSGKIIKVDVGIMDKLSNNIINYKTERMNPIIITYKLDNGLCLFDTDIIPCDNINNITYIY